MPAAHPARGPVSTRGVDAPRTRAWLAADLRSLGVRPGSTLLVHSAMRPLGWVCGGPHAVVLALRDAVGPEGTLVVPTHTPDNSDPATWRTRRCRRSWWPTDPRGVAWV